MVQAVIAAAGVEALLDELVETLPDVDAAVVLSPDGLVVSVSYGVPTEFAAYLSAASAGLYALAGAVGRHNGSRAVHQAIVEMERVLLVVTPVGPRAILAVMLDGAPDFTTVGGQIADFAKRVNHRLVPGPPGAGPGSGS
jgi:predicted regulator of Ras-like GTPase activity (Roadblock/LC7/MglB family)